MKHEAGLSPRHRKSFGCVRNSELCGPLYICTSSNIINLNTTIQVCTNVFGTEFPGIPSASVPILSATSRHLTLGFSIHSISLRSHAKRNQSVTSEHGARSTDSARDSRAAGHHRALGRCRLVRGSSRHLSGVAGAPPRRPHGACGRLLAARSGNASPDTTIDSSRAMPARACFRPRG